MDQNGLNRYVAGGVFLIALGIYLKTMAPSVSFWDCGEFIACATTLGVPHPPGSPLFVLIGRLFSFIPITSDVAFRVNLVSVFTSALSVSLIYLVTVRLIGLRSGREARISAHIGGAVGSLSLAFSSTFWLNATEAEVYGFSMLFTSLGLYLALVWVERHNEPWSDRLLLFIAYLFGLGGGVHLMCLLTVPTILLLIIYTDPRPFGRPKLWVGSTVLFLLGYSVYLTLFIRSGLQPAIDQNDPETLSSFWKFLTRDQYMEGSLLLNVFNRKAQFWDYQIWNMGVKYLLQQFPLHFPNIVSEAFRKATGPEGIRLIFSPIPYVLGLWGMTVHFRKDPRRFMAMSTLFIIMSLGLIVYLNMDDPEPRERDYVFVGAFAAFAIWMGLGAADLIWEVRRRPWIRAATGAILLLVPAGIAASGFEKHDRTGNFIAQDYAHNILQTCRQNAVLFTNGDNDTYPLWYLQEVRGVRKDVRVVNLSLLNTSWYIKQLRDFEPRLPIPYSDDQIETLTTNEADEVIRSGRFWPKAKAVSAGGITWEIPKNPYMYLRAQDVMIWKTIAWAEGKRPIYFAVTVPQENTVGLEPFLVMEGMALRLGDRRGVLIDPDLVWHNLREVYRLRGINDKEIPREGDTEDLLSNYKSVCLRVARAFHKGGEKEKAREVLRWAEHVILESDPKQRLGFADAMVEVGAFDQAIDLYRKAIDGVRAGDGMRVSEKLHVIESAKFNIAVALERKGSIPEAIVALEELRKMNPEDKSVKEALNYLREKVLKK